MTVFRSSPADDFPILLSATDRHWAQFIYQFAHEFCHILCEYERPRSKSNHWIQESLCEVAALFALKQMAVRWQTAAPYPNWREYAPHLGEYADKLITEPENRLPSGVTLREWLRDNERNLRGDPCQRSLNRLIAVHLLLLFQIFPPGWQIV